MESPQRVGQWVAGLVMDSPTLCGWPARSGGARRICIATYFFNILKGMLWDILQELVLW